MSGLKFWDRPQKKFLIGVFCDTNNFGIRRKRVNHFKSAYIYSKTEAQLQGGGSTSRPERRQSDAGAAGRTAAGWQLRFVF